MEYNKIRREDGTAVTAAVPSRILFKRRAGLVKIQAKVRLKFDFGLEFLIAIVGGNAIKRYLQLALAPLQSFCLESRCPGHDIKGAQFVC